MRIRSEDSGLEFEAGFVAYVLEHKPQGVKLRFEMRNGSLLSMYNCITKVRDKLL